MMMKIYDWTGCLIILSFLTFVAASTVDEPLATPYCDLLAENVNDYAHYLGTSYCAPPWMTQDEFVKFRQEISPATLESFPELNSALEVGHGGIAYDQLLMPRSYGLYLEDLHKIDFIHGSFKASGKVFVRKINMTSLLDIYSEEEIQRLFPNTTWPDRVDDHNQTGYYSNLPELLRNIWDDEYYPVCNFAAHRAESLLSLEEYENSPMSFANSPNSLDPVLVQRNGVSYVKYLRFQYARFYFTPLRSQWPFQPQRLIVVLAGGRKSGNTLIMKNGCVSRALSGFADPMWSWMTNNSPKLSLRVNITNMGLPEMTNLKFRSDFPMHAPCEGEECLETRSVQSSGVFFSFLYYPSFPEAFFQIVPILISSLATLINFATPYDSKDIVAAMLLLTGALSAHTQASGNQFRNVVDQSFTIIDTMAFVNYLIAVLYIVTVVALKAMLKRGKTEEARIFYKFMRSFTVSFALLYICPFAPLFGYEVVASDYTYEEQVLVTDHMIWAIVLPVIILIQLAYAYNFWLYHKRNQLNKLCRLRVLEYQLEVDQWEPSDVCIWIMTSPTLKTLQGNELEHSRRRFLVDKLKPIHVNGHDLLKLDKIKNVGIPDSLIQIVLEGLRHRGECPLPIPEGEMNVGDASPGMFSWNQPLLSVVETAEHQAVSAADTFDT